MSVSSRIGAAWKALRSRPRQKRNYDGADFSRLLADWVASRLSADDETRWAADRLRARAREMERNNAIARQFLRMVSVNVIGPDGVKLQARVRDGSGKLNTAANERIEEAWEEWSASPLVDGKMDLSGFSRLMMRTVARDGEAFVRIWRGFDGNRFGLALQPIDADQVDATISRHAETGRNEVRLGVEVDEFGRPVAYHCWNRVADMVGSVPRKLERIPADEIIHLYDPDRVNQTRGVTWFAAVMVPMRHLNGYVESEAVAARVSAAKMFFFERKENSDGPPLSEQAGGGMNLEAVPGTGMVLPDGYTASSWDPNHPNTAFEAFLKGMLREIALGLGVSYPALANDLSDVNYSSMRSGLLLERDNWRTLQQWWIGAFLRRVYPEFLNMALLNRALQLESYDARNYLSARWSPRGWAWVDPLKDTQAGALGIQNGLVSRTDLLAEQGLDFEDVLEELREEQQLASEYGLNIDGGAARPAVEKPSMGATPPAGQTADEGADATDAEDAADVADPAEEADAARSAHPSTNGHGKDAAMAITRSRF